MVYTPVTYDRRHDRIGMATKFDHKQAIELFKMLRSQSEVAKIYGVSRERIRQILNMYSVEVKSKHKDRPHRCTMCGRTDQQVHITYRSLCHYCSRKGHAPPPHYTECLNCGIPFTKTHKFREVCDNCAYKINHNGYRDYLKKHQKLSNKKHAPAIKLKRAEWYKAHKDYHLNYYQANIEKSKLASKAYYLKNKKKIQRYFHKRYLELKSSA